MATARALVSIQSLSAEPQAAKIIPTKALKLPAVFSAPIRTDIVHFVHTLMAKNRRQPYAVNDQAGMQHSAESWGTGRAVARIPRISGGGTHRSGEGAFGNMCRQGRMAHPTKIWRRWHRKINTNQKRYAVVSALAASAIPSLVLARGHRIEEIPEVPLVVDNSLEAIEKTVKAKAALETVKAYTDVEKSTASRKLRAGIGKGRNRRYVQRRGPLVVYDRDNGVTHAFRNLPGVELCQVERLNLLQLAPGGHVGRFIIWTQGAFSRLDEIYGTFSTASQQKHGYVLPRASMTNADVARIINSEEVQSVVRPKIPNKRTYVHKKNPLRNFGVMVKLNPYALTLRRQELVAQRRNAKRKAEAALAKEKGEKIPATAKAVADRKHKKLHKAAQKKTYQRLTAESAYDRSTEIKQ